jgi:hypothetical protein
VREYWFVDPDADVVRVHSGAREQFDNAVELSTDANDVLTTVLIPGLQISLRRLFRPLEISVVDSERQNE